MTPHEDKDGWDRYQKLVLSELANNATCSEKLEKAIEKLTDSMLAVKIDMGKISESVKVVVQEEKDLIQVKKDLFSMNREMGEIQTKSGFWGVLGGILSASLAYIIGHT